MKILLSENDLKILRQLFGFPDIYRSSSFDIHWPAKAKRRLKILGRLLSRNWCKCNHTVRSSTGLYRCNRIQEVSHKKPFDQVFTPTYLHLFRRASNTKLVTSLYAGPGPHPEPQQYRFKLHTKQKKLKKWINCPALWV